MYKRISLFVLEDGSRAATITKVSDLAPRSRTYIDVTAPSADRLSRLVYNTPDARTRPFLSNDGTVGWVAYINQEGAR